MTSYRDDDLGAALEALRPSPSAAFAAELDARVAAGFPRRGAGPVRLPAGERLARLWSRPRLALLPAAGLALAAVAIATAAIAISGGQGPSAPHGDADLATSTPARESAAPAASEATPAPSETPAGTAPNTAGASSAEAGAAEYEATSPVHSGPYASGHAQRQVERAASITLSDQPSHVRSDAAQVFQAVHAAGGFVLRSTIHDGSSGEAGAEFELLIPSAKLGDALAAFSGIAEVRARHQSTADITAPTVATSERLADSRARIESLLSQLAGEETESERLATEQELSAERDRAAGLRSDLSGLRRRANLSRVSLRIETGEHSSGGSAGWGLGDGLDDAGRILSIAAGVTVIGLAALAPLALLALLAWLVQRAWLRRSRRQALAQ